MRPGP
ncbi:unnamed protein product, partial [Didymodactylos carnosus]